MKNFSAERFIRSILITILLAIFCISIAELAACRYYDRETYDKIVAPIRRCSAFIQRTTADTARRGVEITLFAADRTAQAAFAFSVGVQNTWTNAMVSLHSALEDLNRQRAEEPAIVEDIDPDPSITKLDRDGDTLFLVSGTHKTIYFNQGDDPWASQPFGADDIGRYGCGPTAMAMVVANFTNYETDPAAMAQWAYEHGYWARQSGSYLSIIQGTANAYGLPASSITEKTPEAVTDILEGGSYIVALMGPGHFTKSGHFIVLRGVTPDGQVLIADPSSVERSLTVWDPAIILDELSHSTAHGAPLWKISPPAKS